MNKGDAPPSAGSASRSVRFAAPVGKFQGRSKATLVWNLSASDHMVTVCCKLLAVLRSVSYRAADKVQNKGRVAHDMDVKHSKRRRSAFRPRAAGDTNSAGPVKRGRHTPIYKHKSFEQQPKGKDKTWSR